MKQPVMENMNTQQADDKGHPQNKEKAPRRENISLPNDPASLRKIYNKEVFLTIAPLTLTLIALTATGDLMKCPGKTKNREKIFKKDDTVYIFYLFNGDLCKPRYSGSYADIDVWFYVKGKSVLWRRKLDKILEKAKPVGTEAVCLNITQKGLAGKYAKKAAEKVEQKTCFYVDLKNCGFSAGIWIDSELMENDEHDNYTINTEKFTVSPFKTQEKNVAPGPESSFVPKC